MADYIEFEAEVEHIEHDDEVRDFSNNVSENSFIDDQDVNTDVNFIEALQMLKMILNRF